MGGRVTWQEARRVETRDRLLDAAQRVFARSSYAGTTVNDILDESGVGRTSFYKHFNDRLAVAQALFERFMPDMSDTYVSIVSYEKIDQASVSHWLDRLVDRYADNAAVMRVFAQVVALEPDFGKSIEKVQHQMMGRLGERFPLFARAATAPNTLDPSYTEATLLIDMIDHVCATISIRKVPVDRKTAVEFLAEAVNGVLQKAG